MTLLRSFFWLLIFLGATFVFGVLFQYGPANFSENAQKQFAEIQGYVSAAISKPATPPKGDKG